MKNIPFLSIGFRPFFLMTALSAVFFPMYLVSVLINGYPYPGEILDVISWHGHELLFGMAPALITGFLLTASSNWTGTKPLSGFPLLLLVILWVATRVVFFVQPDKYLMTALAPLLIVCLAGLMYRKLKGNRNRYILCGLLTVFTLAHALYLWGALWGPHANKQIGITLASGIIAALLILFSGRLIPAFTNGRAKEPLISGNIKLDVTCLTGTLIVVLLESFLSNKYPAAILALLVGSLLLRRCQLFYHRKILEDFLVYALHLANLWLPVFLYIKALTLFNPAFDIGKPALHALFTGAMASFSLVIMTRASLGHTGRPLIANRVDKLIFFSTYCGAMMRVFMPLLDKYTISSKLHISMGFWTLGFLIFLFRFGPIYFKPRADAGS